MQNDGKLHLYLASVIAFRSLPMVCEDRSIELLNNTSHQGAVFPAVNLEEALHKAKEFAFSKWPERDGWSDHHVVMHLVTNGLKDIFQAGHEAEMIGTDIGDDWVACSLDSADCGP